MDKLTDLRKRQSELIKRYNYLSIMERNSMKVGVLIAKEIELIRGKIRVNG